MVGVDTKTTSTKFSGLLNKVHMYKESGGTLGD